MGQRIPFAQRAKLPNQHGFEPTQPGVTQQSIQFRPAGLGSADAGVYVLREYFPAVPADVFTQLVSCISQLWSEVLTRA